MRSFERMGDLMLRTVLLFAVSWFAAAAVKAQALEGRLKKIAETKTIAIAYRADAVPFSYVNERKQVDGFSIELCKRVVNSIERR
jgi:glutamate/aspartate transport system substrate-binding protein